MTMNIFFLTLFVTSSVALPLQNSTIPIKVGWISAPQARGTFDLLLSCLTTLSLCAWTAYHPNISPARNAWRQLAHRTLWMLIAVFVPEAVLWCAWEQWWASRRLRNRINAVVGMNDRVTKEELGPEDCGVCGSQISENGSGPDEEEERVLGLESQPTGELESCAITNEDRAGLPIQPSTTSGPLEPSSHSVSPTLTATRVHGSDGEIAAWTLEQAFFAIAGGYALPSPVPSRPPLTLTPSGILLLLQLNVFPDVSPSQISDKSKADAIAKALVCMQAGWFMIQCIARAARRLPVTVLEIHVLAHVLCTFAIYAVWFEKGYDVGSPIVLEGEIAKYLGALFAADDGQRTEARPQRQLHCACSTRTLTVSDIEPYHRNSPYYPSTMKYWNKLLEYLEMKPVSRKMKHIAMQSSTNMPELSVHLQHANRALGFLTDRRQHLLFTSEVGTGIQFNERYTVPTRSDLTVEGLDASTKHAHTGSFRDRQMETYAVLSILYASFHLLAWSPSHFPTMIETWLWRGSALAMLAAPAFIMLGVMVPSLRPPASWPATSVRRLLYQVCNLFLNTLWFTFMTVGALACCCYPLARLFMLAESFAGLRSVDQRVYQTLEWTELLPHAG